MSNFSFKRLDPAQVAMLLPTQSEIRELMDRCGHPKLNQAIHQMMADISVTPNNPELWLDLAKAFGLCHMLKWKFLHVAHGLQPDNFQISTDLAFTYYFLDDQESAIDLMEKIIASTNSDNDRAVGIEYLNTMKYPESVNYPSLARM